MVASDWCITLKCEFAFVLKIPIIVCPKCAYLQRPLGQPDPAFESFVTSWTCICVQKQLYVFDWSKRIAYE